MTEADARAEDHLRLMLPSTRGFELTSGSFEIPQATVTIGLKPELVSELLDLLAGAVEAGIDAAWFRPRFENAAPMVVETGDPVHLDAFVDLAVLAHRHELLSSADVGDVRTWTDASKRTEPVDRPVPVERREQWDEGRVALQSCLDPLNLAVKKKLLRQRSIARVTCSECNSMLAWLVPQGRFEFLVLARGDSQAFEVAHAVGEYGGYARTRCGRRGGRTWVMHADHLRQWLDDGNADVSLRHTDKGM